MTNVVIVDALRTAMGRRNGSFNQTLPIDMLAAVLKAIVERTGIDPARVDDVIAGCVTATNEQGGNIARLAVLRAGFPVSVPAVTVNRLCGSSQQAIHFASQAIAAGDMDLVIACGVENMTRVPMFSDWAMNVPKEYPYDLPNQGISAELIAERWGLNREELDEFSLGSHARAAAATRNGHFKSEILPFPVTGPDGQQRLFAVDEGIRFEPDRAKMASLQPAFKPGGLVTAGNSSQITDGAAAVLLASERMAERLNLRPRARIVTRVVVGDDPVLMLTGPIPATRKALNRTGLTPADIDTFEINEAFASVVLAWMREIEPPAERVNPNGGAIALGHPLGATGARLMTTLLNHLKRTGGRYGLQTMCIGHGQATATIVERL